jgi:hypothetical protein
MTNGYVIPLDPSELGNRFAENDSGIEELEARGPGIPEEDLTQIDAGYEDDIEPLLDLIPPREADLIFLYYIKKKKQADIAAIFGVTQAAISYRIERGLQRIKFLLKVPNIPEEDMRRDLPLVPFKPIDVDILVHMWTSTCQSDVANKLGLTQGRVRHRFFKAVKVLEAKVLKDPRFEPYQRVFSSIANKNFNVLRSVQLPQWQGRGIDECI